TFSNIRFRYKLETHYSISSKFNVIAFDEIFINVGKKIINNTFDHNRLGLGLQFSLLKNLDLELTYINWFQELQSGSEYFKRDIVRLAFNHVIPIAHKTNQ